MTLNIKHKTNRLFELGRLQERILKHLIQSKIYFDSASDLANLFSLRQPTVSKSVKSLLKHHYLVYETWGHHPQKRPIITAKGAAVLLAESSTTFDQVKDYARRNDGYQRRSGEIVEDHKHLEVLGFVKKIIKNNKRHTPLFAETMKYALENDYFDKGNFRQLTKEEMQKIKLFIVLEYIDATQDIPTIRDFIDKYGVDKDFLKKHLLKQRKYLDLAIQQLY